MAQRCRAVAPPTSSSPSASPSSFVNVYSSSNAASATSHLSSSYSSNAATAVATFASASSIHKHSASLKRSRDFPADASTELVPTRAPKTAAPPLVKNEPAVKQEAAFAARKFS